MADRRVGSKMLFLFIGVLLLAASYVSGGQNPEQPKEDRTAWKRVAQPLATEPADPARRARIEKWDNEFDSSSLAKGPLEDLYEMGGAIGMVGDNYGEVPDLPVSPDSSVVIAKFEDYQAHLSRSHRSLYTEVTMRVERSLYPGPTLLVSGSVATVLLPGGAVQLPNGRALRVADSFNPLGIQPGHRYVLFLHYEPSDDSYSVRRCWELSDGHIKPCEDYDLNRSTRVIPRYAGMTESAFVEVVEKLLRERLDAPGK